MEIYLILHKWTWQVISMFYVPAWKLIYIIIHNEWSLAWIFMKEKVNLLSSLVLLKNGISHRIFCFTASSGSWYMYQFLQMVTNIIDPALID